MDEERKTNAKSEKPKKSAFESAMDALDRAPRTLKEIKEHLYKKGYHKPEVEETLEKLKGYNLVDDEKYVEIYVDYYSNRLGRKKLEYTLTAEKGIDAALVREKLADLLSDEGELDKAVALSEKKLRQKRYSQKAYNGLGNWLYSKGFEWSIITKALAAVKHLIEFEETTDEDTVGFDTMDTDFDD